MDRSSSEKCRRPIGTNLIFVGESLRAIRSLLSRANPPCYAERSEGSTLRVLPLAKEKFWRRGFSMDADDADGAQMPLIKERERLFQKGRSRSLSFSARSAKSAQSAFTSLTRPGMLPGCNDLGSLGMTMPQSPRIAINGSTCAARRAGSHPAASAAARSTSATTTYVKPSVGAIP